MAHFVKCIYCSMRFDRDKLAFHQVSERRFAHMECWARAEAAAKQEEQDKLNLEKYISELFGEGYVNAKTRKQIKTYREEYNYTYSGILKALTYFFEIKKGDVSKANNGIGIVPYCYKAAHDYYYALWLAKERNQGKDIEAYRPEVIEIKIPSPQRNIEKRQLFTFLDEEVENE